MVEFISFFQISTEWTLQCLLETKTIFYQTLTVKAVQKNAKVLVAQFLFKSQHQIDELSI